MKRDRSRTDIESLLLKLLLRAGTGGLDGRLLTPTAFARDAGLSRQALYKNHDDIVAALTYLAKARTADPSISELRSRIKNLSQEKADSDEKLKGAVKQNGKLVVEIYELRQQLKAKGLRIVGRKLE